MTPSLAAVVLTFNEERHVGPCLDSLAWAPRRVVVDSFSTDRTLDIARDRGTEILQHRFADFAAQRNFALEAVEADWILFVDADERATPALAAEVLRVIAAPTCAGWWIPRHNYIIGHRMRGAGWYPDPQLRLLRRGLARYDPARPVHEIVLLDGPEGTLDNVLVHYNYDSLGLFLRKQSQYAAYEAHILHARGIRPRAWTYLTMPLREFWRRFITLRGYLDHVYGLLFSLLLAYYTFVTYWRLRKLHP